MAKQHAEQTYDKFHQQRLQNDIIQVDKNLEQLTKTVSQFEKVKKSSKKS